MKSIIAKVPWLKNSNNDNRVVGVALSKDQVIVTLLERQGQDWLLAKTEVVAIANESELSENLTSAINALDVSGCKVAVVLANTMCQVVQMDKPALPVNEIAASLPWTLKDLVSFPSDTIIADFIESPIKQAGQDKITVFASNSILLNPIINALTKSNCELELLTSQEMAYCHMLAGDSAAHMLVSQELGEEPNLLIIRDGQLLLSRRLRGFNKFAELPLAQLKMSLLEMFGLELQRSLDFFESQLKQPPIKTLQLNIPNLELPGIIDELAQFFPVKVVGFEPQVEICKTQALEMQFAITGALLLSDGGADENTH